MHYIKWITEDWINEKWMYIYQDKKNPEHTVQIMYYFSDKRHIFLCGY